MILNIAGTEANLEGVNSERYINSVDHRKSWPIALLIVFISLVTVLPLSLQTNFDNTIPISFINSLNQSIIMWGTQAYTATETINTTTNIDWTSITSSGSLLDTPNQVQVLGITLYTHGAIWLLLVSFLLILAIIVPLALAFT